MIYINAPDDWQDLEEKVNDILSHSGFQSNRNVEIETARGKVDVDVLAVDQTSNPKIIYICECKHWSTAVPKSIIHSFRTVLNDYGAHVGIIISRNGFQSGAVDAAKHSNIKLVNWFEFQELFIQRWKKYKYESLRPLFEEVFDYYDYFCAPIGNAISGKQERLDEWNLLLRKYEFAAQANPWSKIAGEKSWPPNVPFMLNILNFDGSNEEIHIPDYGSLYTFIENHSNEALNAFKGFIQRYTSGPVGEL